MLSARRLVEDGLMRIPLVLPKETRVRFVRGRWVKLPLRRVEQSCKLDRNHMFVKDKVNKGRPNEK